MKISLRHFFLFVLAAGLRPALLQADPIGTYITGLSLPETVSLAPATFGTYAGQLIISDSGAGPTTGPGSLYAAPVTGGTATQFSSYSGAGYAGGGFAPTSYGSLSGQYIAVGETSSRAAIINEINSGGSVTNLYTGTAVSEATNFSVAPATFGSAANKIVVPYINGTNPGSLLLLNPDGSTSSFGSALPIVNPFGSAFAPAGFGSVGGDLLLSDGTTGTIVAIDSTGNAKQFANIGLGSGQVGLRQMAFAPAGFGLYGGDLFVSVASLNGTGGTNGEVLVVDANGNIVAALLQGTVDEPFNPRGLYFLNNTELLVSNADPSVLLATPLDFTSAAPEPAGFGLAAAGLAVLVWRMRRRASTAKRI